MQRIFCLFFCLLLAVLIPFTVSAASIGFVCGDADGDGTITSIDVTTAQRVIAEIFADTDGMITRRTDVDGDGLSLPDVTAIQRYLAGLTDKHHIGEWISDDPIIGPTEDNQLPIMK